MCHCPTTPVQARFSMEFVLAAAIAYGQLTLNEFSEDKISDPRVTGLMERVHMQLDDELAQLGFIGTAPVRLVIRLASGEVIDGSRDLARGNPEKPFSDNERAAKFLGCCDGILPLHTAHWVLERLFDLDRESSIGPLLRELM